ncbi:putative pentatricopeptide repeat-containing protein At1g12700, mitochondrial [Rosa rugosa]|uniref:putative pentatricopeptide repeat-containing protein At1g12700, mitochondrial n=1 Tax=Rosa rugosa TaxID=74645 RepID=UPI002B417289|nr:putative pentatricopeptide repeat-containing protein At1g12700, mitochondrial [Rosa rugosa]
MAEASSPNYDDLKNHVMKVFEDATKDCEDKDMKRVFDSIGDYDSFNNYAIEMFGAMENLGLGDEARELFKPLSDRAVLRDVAVHTVVIRAYAVAGKTKAVLKAYQHMIATGIAPSSLTYTILINALVVDYSDYSFVGYVKNYILEMLDKGMKPHPICYLGLFGVLGCRESVEKATEFLVLINAKGLSPESNYFNIEEGHFKKAIKVYTNVSNITTDKDAQKVFRKWRTNAPGLKKELMKMINALVKDGKLDESMEMYRDIIETGREPFVLLHTCVIKAYLKSGKTKSAFELYRGMLAAGVSPNSYTYTVLIKGLAADPNFFGEAKKCLLEMMDRGKRPNAATYTAVIELFARQESKAAEEEGKVFVEVMMGKGFVPNAKAMSEVLKGRPTPVIRRVMSIVLSKLKH